MKKLYILALIIFLAAKSFAQTSSCAQTIRLAQSIYDQGRLHELEDLINRQLGKGDCSKSEQVSLLKLLTLSYIYLEEPKLADEKMLQLLETDHYFVINEAVDPAEFVALYNTFRTTPIFRFGLNAGTVASKPYVLEFNPISEGNGEYSHRFGFDVGVISEIPITNFISFNPALHLSIKSFSNSFTGINPNSTVSFSTSIGKESQYWISLPLQIQYHVYGSEESKAKPKHFVTKLNPYVTAGVSFDYMANSSLQVEQKRSKEQSIELRTISMSPQRELLNVSMLVGAGGKVRAAGGYIVGEIKFSYGLNQINSSSSLLSNQQLLFDYGYADGIFKINSVFISTGYVHNFFNPKKKKIN